jgi:N-acetylglutamate synthase-like GNAT family acetyltransferase/acetylglutamate kinase
MPQPAPRPSPIDRFDEKQFYLDEFRNKTLLFAALAEDLKSESHYDDLAAIVRALLPNDTRVIVLVGSVSGQDGERIVARLKRRLGPMIFSEELPGVDASRRSKLLIYNPVDAGAFASSESATDLLSRIWTTLRSVPLFIGVGNYVNRQALYLFAKQVASRLRVHKLVLLDPEGGLKGADGKRISFMDEPTLEMLLGAGEAEWTGLEKRLQTVEAVRAALLAGVANVNLCSLDGAASELFTYEGSGTLFTLQDYCTVERLCVDDYEEVERLMARGQREGVLKPRTGDEVAQLLVNGYGATIGAHHLAGICSLLITEDYRRAAAGEIIGLYTMTRFKGESIGDRLFKRALQDARAADLKYVFAATTEERAQAFFERLGFRRVDFDDVPPSKWALYDPARKQQVAVLRYDLKPRT